MPAQVLLGEALAVLALQLNDGRRGAGRDDAHVGRVAYLRRPSSLISAR